MFDKVIYAPPAKPSVTNVNVQMVDPSVEKGARFLDEVQSKAEERIANAMVTDISSIDAKLVSYESWRSHESYGVQHHLAFKINGKLFHIKAAPEMRWDEKSSIEEFVNCLTREILKQVAPRELMATVNPR